VPSYRRFGKQAVEPFVWSVFDRWSLREGGERCPADKAISSRGLLHYSLPIEVPLGTGRHDAPPPTGSVAAENGAVGVGYQWRHVRDRAVQQDPATDGVSGRMTPRRALTAHGSSRRWVPMTGRWPAALLAFSSVIVLDAATRRLLKWKSVDGRVRWHSPRRPRLRQPSEQDADGNEIRYLMTTPATSSMTRAAVGSRCLVRKAHLVDRL
jgi:hypothetical protein